MTRHWYAVAGLLCLLPALQRSAWPKPQGPPNPPKMVRLKAVASSAAPDFPAVPGVWISPAELATLPLSGPGYLNIKEVAGRPCRAPDLANQDESANTCVLAKALMYARTREDSYYADVASALGAVVSMPPYSGRALSLARKLPTYVIAADIVDLKTRAPGLDAAFRSRIKDLLATPTTSGPASLTECHERRPNNWGTHCGAARAAVAAYLGDREELARVARVFKGWLGDRSSYAGFKYGSDLSWQCDPAVEVGINPKGCEKNGHSIDGVLPDDQRRGGSFAWPPVHENYVYEALQGAMVQAVILRRAGYDVFEWQDQALLRAFQWLYTQNGFPAQGDDVWMIPLVNYYYGTTFPCEGPLKPGKNMGWTDWTHARPPAVISEKNRSASPQ